MAFFSFLPAQKQIDGVLCDDSADSWLVTSSAKVSTDGDLDTCTNPISLPITSMAYRLELKYINRHHGMYSHTVMADITGRGIACLPSGGTTVGVNQQCSNINGCGMSLCIPLAFDRATDEAQLQTCHFLCECSEVCQYLKIVLIKGQLCAVVLH